MAVMWPREFPQEFRSLAERNAERKVYGRLSEALEDDFVVFYSRPWLGMTWDGIEVDGECDFVIAHPEYGYLALEVKGGGVAYDPEFEEWTSMDRNGDLHTIKDPVEQAKRSKHEILRKMTASEHWVTRYIRACHGVVLPDIQNPGEDLGADMPLHIFCFHDEIEHDLRSWVIERFELCADPDARIQPLGEDGIRALEDILARPIQLSVPLGRLIEDDDARIHSLTPTQFRILGMLQGRKRVAISGSAGTGKTVLAMEEAVRCADRGLSVLLTCYNKALGHSMQETLKMHHGITVGHYHGFCNALFKEAGISLDRDVPLHELFLQQYPNALIEALEILPETRFDAIIIDEGQDFPPELVKSLVSLLDPGGENLIRFFYDDNQNVYSNTYEHLKDFFELPFPLTANLRNTKKIHEVAGRYYRGNETEAIGPDGKEVAWIEAESPLAAKDAVDAYVGRLVHQEGVSPPDIAVLVPRSEDKAVFFPAGMIAGMRSHRCDATGDGSITLDSVRRFKGLERLVVILVVTDALIESEEKLYVALSRPRALLAVVGRKEDLETILRDYPPIRS